MGGIAAVGIAGKAQVEGVNGAVGGVDTLVGDAPLWLGAAEFTAIRQRLGRAPIQHAIRAGFVDDGTSGARAAGGIAHPAEARGHPHHVGRIPGHGGHAHVIAVGDHGHIRPRIHAGPQHALDLVDLTHAIQLIAAEVQQYQHGSVQLLGNVGNVQLIDFQHHQLGIAAGQERGNHAGIHVVSALVGGHGVRCAQRSGQHAGGGGLAVGAGDQHHWALFTQRGHQMRVNPTRDEATDHSAGTTSGLPASPSREVCRADRDSTPGTLQDVLRFHPSQTS